MLMTFARLNTSCAEPDNGEGGGGDQRGGSVTGFAGLRRVDHVGKSGPQP